MGMGAICSRPTVGGPHVSSTGHRITLPLAPGIFKHPTVEDLRRLLEDPEGARKYTIAALRKAIETAEEGL